MKSDIEIAQSVKLKHISEIAENAGIVPDDLELYGKYKAKLPLSLIDESRVKNSNLILVTAITPTPSGEGKTTVSIGLAQGMNRIGKNTTVVLREPSLGPVFGLKGGAAGGGMSQVLPMEEINLHFTGDLAAVEKAHNLLAALIDNNLQNLKYTLGIDPRTIRWKRVIDMNERALRNIIVGLGGPKHGMPRESGFDITAASEIMAVLCLAKNIDDLKTRLGNIFVGHTYDGKPVFAKDLKAQGAMAALLKDAIKPNLVQTIEGTPAIIHGGPFANIAQGTNSILGTKMGMTISGHVVTEAGFASDLGAEKFLNIKCQYGGLSPKAVVVVATIRALKYHGGKKLKELNDPDPEAVEKGLPNLEKHLENIGMFNLVPVVAVNKFTGDTDEEINVVLERCKTLGYESSVAEGWEKGGEGTVDLAEKVIKVINEGKSGFRPLYSFNSDIEKKINTIAENIYGAANVEYSVQAKIDIKNIIDLGLDKLPVCIAKTQKSLSDNPYLKGRPEGFTVKIREVELAAGAGFVIPIAGNIMRMPGLPPLPAAENIDIDKDGTITGLF